MDSIGAAWTLAHLRERHASGGRLYDEFLRVAALSAGLYRLAAGSTDPQGPHGEDEIYVVLSGAGAIEVEGRRSEVEPGSVVYVSAGADHRFVDITDDLELLVVFAPPESA